MIFLVMEAAARAGSSAGAAELPANAYYIAAGK
jgi:hypothetical protein